MERTIELELIAASQEFGLAICTGSPLAGGFLSGKYRREGSDWKGFDQFRRSCNPLLRKLAERHWRVWDATLEIAKKMGKTPAQIALNWVATQPGVTSSIIGATKLAQLQNNLGAIEFTILAELRTLLDDASAIELGSRYMFLGQMLQSRITGGSALRPWIPVEVYPNLKAAPSPVEVSKASAVER